MSLIDHENVLDPGRELSLMVVDSNTLVFFSAEVIQELHPSLSHLPDDPTTPEFVGGWFIRRGRVNRIGLIEYCVQ